MDRLKDIVIDIYPLSVELSISDFALIIEAALTHQDEFFLRLIKQLDEATKENEKNFTNEH